MRLLKLGPNAHTLETSCGAILFSYENTAAVKVLDPCGEPYRVFVHCDRPMSPATRAHVERFSADTRAGWTKASAAQLGEVVREVMEGA